MPKRIVSPENIPSGTSWVYLLDAQEAIHQCRIFGLEPAATLAANRVLLCDFLTNLKINGGSLDPPENQYPEIFSSEDSTQPPHSLTIVAEPKTTDILGPGLESPPTSAAANSAIGAGTHTAAVSNNQPPISNLATLTHSQPGIEPPWQKLIAATAAAVGESIARALTTNNLVANSRPSFDSCPRVLQDLVNRIPITSGSDPREFIEFLIQVEKIRQLNLADPHALLVSLLPRTSNQLRTTWIRAVADNTPIQDLMQSLLNFFLPHRLRHSMVSDLLYRSQRPNEPLAEFISDLQDCQSLLMPALPQGELLEIVLTGINHDTRSRLAGFPAPSSVDELLALAPRIEVISRMSVAASSNPPPNFDAQPNRQNNRPYNGGQQRGQPNRFHYRDQSHNSQRGRGQAPFHRPQGAANQSRSYSTPQSNHAPGQLNSPGGQ